MPTNDPEGNENEKNFGWQPHSHWIRWIAFFFFQSLVSPRERRHVSCFIVIMNNSFQRHKKKLCGGTLATDVFVPPSQHLSSMNKQHPNSFNSKGRNKNGIKSTVPNVTSILFLHSCCRGQQQQNIVGCSITIQYTTS